MKRKTKLLIKLIFNGALMLICLFALVTIPVYAWLAENKISIYAPITTNTALYIGAGNEEDIKYLYLENIDLTSDVRHKDYVFSVSGAFVRHYKIQLAYTTNNQFTFELYRAIVVAGDNAFASVASPTLVNIRNYYEKVNGEYVKTTDTAINANKTYYVVDADVKYTTQEGEDIYYKISGSAIAGIIPNETASNSNLGKNNDYYYSDTYGSYRNVNKYAVPLYWQMASTVDISKEVDGQQVRDDFPHFYILRVIFGDKEINDRETDIICIAAKDFSQASN